MSLYILKRLYSYSVENELSKGLYAFDAESKKQDTTFRISMYQYNKMKFVIKRLQKRFYEIDQNIRENQEGIDKVLSGLDDGSEERLQTDEDDSKEEGIIIGGVVLNTVPSHVLKREKKGIHEMIFSGEISNEYKLKWVTNVLSNEIDIMIGFEMDLNKLKKEIEEIITCLDKGTYDFEEIQKNYRLNKSYEDELIEIERDHLLDMRKVVSTLNTQMNKKIKYEEKKLSAYQNELDEKDGSKNTRDNTNTALRTFQYRKNKLFENISNIDINNDSIIEMLNSLEEFTDNIVNTNIEQLEKHEQLISSIENMGAIGESSDEKDKTKKKVRFSEVRKKELTDDEKVQNEEQRQEEIAGDITVMARDLKRKSQAISDTLDTDNVVLDKLGNTTNNNLAQIKKEQTNLDEHTKDASISLFTKLKYLIFVVFVMMSLLVIMKVFPKR